MIILLIVCGLLLGLLVGYNIPMIFSGAMTVYVSVVILAAIDSMLGALRAHMDDNYNKVIFISGFVTNMILAGVLAYIGDSLGLPLYYVALFVFGTRLFDNIGIIRRHIISKYTGEKFHTK